MTKAIDIAVGEDPKFAGLWQLTIDRQDEAYSPSNLLLMAEMSEDHAPAWIRLRRHLATVGWGKKDVDELIRAVTKRRDEHLARFEARKAEQARSEREQQSDLPTIQLQQSRLPQNLSEAEEALLAAGAPVFQAAGRLVHVVRVDDDQDPTHPRGTLTIRPLAPQRLTEYMMGAAQFHRFDGKSWKPGAPSPAFAQAFMARGEWKLRVLRGILEAPTLRPDGSVLTEPGYDDQMQVVLDTGGVVFPAVREDATEWDAREALDELKDIIAGFPFVTDESGKSPARSVALSAMLTSVSRKAMRTAPGHCIDATAPETGKTLLTDTISVVATGRPVVPISYGGSKAELNKRMFSVLMQGDPVVAIDNIDEELESDELCTILTSETWQNRILGESESRRVSTGVLVMLNGNNLRLKGDITTRVVSCRMDAGLERPGDRVFDIDLRTYVPQHRPRLVSAALTVLRAFVVAGRPGLAKLGPFERFSDWSNLVRGALVWLGEADPLSTRDTVMAIDSEAENVAALHQAWEEAIGLNKRLTATEALKLADPHLDEALMAISPNGTSIPTAKLLGKWMVALDGKIIDGKRIRRHATSGHSTKFWLEEVEPDAGQRG